MSISELVIKGIGVVLAIAGLLLILASVGLNVFGGSFTINPILGIIFGLILIGFGLWIIRGGNITP